MLAVKGIRSGIDGGYKNEDGNGAYSSPRGHGVDLCDSDRWNFILRVECLQPGKFNERDRFIVRK